MRMCGYAYLGKHVLVIEDQTDIEKARTWWACDGAWQGQLINFVSRVAKAAPAAAAAEMATAGYQARSQVIFALRLRL